ncbi:hypothetical protein [Saccharolobus caldissimus]|uniref:Uncharacterized protein n=1 Tax=Saccharolobus caldissimus TaxID=1702097 RepID=A0AAQ4CNR7_9CREN|nr:hypothetical protein [Saccharolobus caldissimus]BDB97448.1 hypothetical protein SACC_04650 [Saccharolobus caldissimus]
MGAKRISYIDIIIGLAGGVISTSIGAIVAKWLDIASRPSFNPIKITATPICFPNKEVFIQCSYMFEIKWKSPKAPKRLFVTKSMLLAENAQGWVELEGLHSSPAPWGYGYHYAMDIVGKESLVVLFLNKNCLKDLNNCNLFFPVRPINSPRWEWDPRSNLFEYNQFKNRKLKIRVASRNANGTEIPCELAKFVERCIEACKSDQDCKKYLNT